jgi:hypothetical protein
MNSFKPWLVLFLVFAAGFAGGVVTTRAVVRRAILSAAAHPESLQARIERRLDARLQLNDDQRDHVHQVLKDTQRDLRDLRLKYQPELVTVVDRGESNINAVLTPVQRRRFERYLDENGPFFRPR